MHLAQHPTVDTLGTPKPTQKGEPTQSEKSTKVLEP